MRSHAKQPLSAADISAWQDLPLTALMAAALQAKLKHRDKDFSLCCIINARSGQCGEDCRFCVQSAHYRTDAPVYPFKDDDDILTAAREAKRIGASRFSIVTSGRGLNAGEVDRAARVIEKIVSQVQISACASLGILGPGALKRLKDAGLTRYHHNLETSREFFDRVVSTHTFNERLETIASARTAGLEICAGGIIGMGESENDRISMALSLRECDVDSIPLNILIPLPGTPMAETPPLTTPEILRTIALYRLIVPEVPLRLVAGRDEPGFRDFLGAAFMAGADALMIGGYLTHGCRPPAEDIRFVSQMKELWSS